MTKPNATVKRDLSPDEIEKLGRHVGHLAREIYLKSIERKEAAKKARDEINLLKIELASAHEILHNGFELIPAQREMFETSDDSDDDLDLPAYDESTEASANDLSSRLDDCRAVVQEAKKEASKDDEYYQRALTLLDSDVKVTVSILRRRLKVGKGRAERLMEMLRAEKRIDDDGMGVPF